MSTKQSQAKKTVASNNSNIEEDDLGALIYRESQLRKAEAAVAAAKRKKTSTASTRRTSTWKRTAVNRDDKSMKTTKTHLPSKKIKRHSPKQTETTQKKADWTKYKKKCSVEGCSNQAVKGGVCVRHGAKPSVKLCSSEGCTNQVCRGGVCKRHGAYRNTHDESTAFGSEYEKTTATQKQLNQRAFRAAIRRQEGRSVPEEVTILCQEIVEV